MKKFLGAFLCCFLAFFATAQTSNTNQVYFEYAKSSLTAEAEESLLQFLEQTTPNAVFKIEIYGHTDQHGNAEYNQKLSAARSKSVANFLSQHGYANAQISIKNYGETNPVASNEHATGRGLNRRVDLVMHMHKDDADDFNTGDATLEKDNSDLNAMFDDLADAPQRFKIKNDKDTVLVGKKGTRICLKANSLIDSRGRPLKGYVKIELNEYYDMADLLLNNLNTESGQQVLETGGTVKLTLKSRGKEVFVKDGSSYALYIPSAQTQNNMSWFDGEHHDQDLLASRVNWVPTENFAQTTTNFRQSAFNWFGFYKNNLSYSGSIGWLRSLYFGVNDIFRTLMLQRSDRIENIRAKRYERLERKGILKRIPFELNIEKLPKSAQASAAAYYMFEGTNFGTINCDRFLKSGRPLITYQVKIKGNRNTDVKMVFKDIRSVMPAYKVSDDTYVFHNVPVGHEVSIVAMQYTNDKPHVAIKATEINRDPIQIESFNPTTKEKLRGAFASL